MKKGDFVLTNFWLVTRIRKIDKKTKLLQGR